MSEIKIAAEPLDWTGFKGIQINKAWMPDDQELIYTAMGVYDHDGDMDDDAPEQIIERLLCAWQGAVQAHEELRRLREAVKKADEAIAYYFRYLDGGETRGSYDGKPERETLRKAGYATSAALRETSL
jgi:hypothetical protein